MTQENLNIETNAAAPANAAAIADKLVAKLIAKEVSLAKLTAEVEALRAEIKARDALTNIEPGTQVVIAIGRADTAREVPAVILAVKTLDDGAVLYKVQYGSGFDTDVITVRAGQIKAVGEVATVSEPAAE